MEVENIPALLNVQSAGQPCAAESLGQTGASAGKRMVVVVVVEGDLYDGN